MNWINRWETFAFAAAFFASLTALFGKMGIANINSNLATFIRVCVVLLLITPILFYFNQWQRPAAIAGKTWVFLILSGVATGLSWLCYYRALQLGPVSKVASIDKLSVALAILLGILVLQEKFSWPVVVGGCLITLGAVVVAMFG